MSLYIYAVGGAIDGDLAPLQGVFDSPVFRFDAGPLCAIVSESRESGVRAERKHIIATQRVLAALNAEFDVLPMAFGTITKSEDELRRFLDDHRETFRRKQRIRGAIEMSLHLNLGASDPIAYLVDLRQRCSLRGIEFSMAVDRHPLTASSASARCLRTRSAYIARGRPRGSWL